MPRENALRVTAFGRVDQDSLQRLRTELGLKPIGRLSDPEDATMGYRHEPDDGVSLYLSRDAEDTWTFKISYEGTPPAGEVVDGYRAEFLAAIEHAGLVVNREWRR